MIPNMGEFMSPILELKIKALGSLKLHDHDCNACGHGEQ